METSTFTLSNGLSVPSIGLGSFDGFSHTEAELATFREAVKVAMAAGYRLIDCADIYGNEEVIGQALEEGYKISGVTREQMFLTSKVYNFNHGRDGVGEAVARSLKRLRTEYLDLYLIHWPVALKNDGQGQSVHPTFPFFLLLLLSTHPSPSLPPIPRPSSEQQHPPSRDLACP